MTAPCIHNRLSICFLAFCLHSTVAYARTVFHFGDSYSSTDFSPDGTLPSKQNPIGNPEFPGSTIWKGTSFISEMIKANPTSGGSPTLVFNYAYPGACINSTLEHNDPSKLDLAAQWANARAHKDHFSDASGDVVSLYFGTNDINQDLSPDFNGDPGLYEPMVMSLVSAMASMHSELGARRFVVFGMDPLYRTPSYVNGDLPLDQTVGALMGVERYNEQLAKQLTEFESKFKDAKVVRFSPLAIFYDVLGNPAKYGAPDNVCHNKGNKQTQKCLWYDTLHPAQPIHDELAKGWAGALKDVGFF